MQQEFDKATSAAACRTLLWNTKEQAGASASRQHLLDVLDSLGAQEQAPWSAQCAVQRQAQQVCPCDELVVKCGLVTTTQCLQVDSRGLSLPVEGAKELLIVTQQDKPLECCLVLRWAAWSLSHVSSNWQPQEPSLLLPVGRRNSCCMATAGCPLCWKRLASTSAGCCLSLRWVLSTLEAERHLRLTLTRNTQCCAMAGLYSSLGRLRREGG